MTATFESRTTARAVLLAACVACMSAACSETHLDAASVDTFRASLDKMNSEHSVEDAITLGDKLAKVKALDGSDATRQRMDHMNWQQANAYLNARLKDGTKR